MTEHYTPKEGIKEKVACPAIFFYTPSCLPASLPPSLVSSMASPEAVITAIIPCSELLPKFFRRANERGFTFTPEHVSEMQRVGEFLDRHNLLCLGPGVGLRIFHASVDTDTTTTMQLPAWSCFIWRACIDGDEHQWVIKVSNESMPRIHYHAEPVNLFFWITRCSELEQIVLPLLMEYKKHLVSPLQENQ